MNSRASFIGRFLADCDRRLRPKTFRALQRNAERIPAGVLTAMPNFTIFVPSLNVNSELGLVVTPAEGYRCVYLSPFLELYPQSEVDFTVAHEFAHISLGHKGRKTNKSQETAADKLAVSWGFKLPKGY